MGVPLLSYRGTPWRAPIATIILKNLPASAGCGKFSPGAYGRKGLNGAIISTTPDVWPVGQASGIVHAFRGHLDHPAHPASAAPCVGMGLRSPGRGGLRDLAGVAI